MNQKDVEWAMEGLEHILDHLPLYHEVLQFLDIDYDKLQGIKETSLACMELQVVGECECHGCEHGYGVKYCCDCDKRISLEVEDGDKDI